MHILLLPGDGVGPEVVQAARDILMAAVTGVAADPEREMDITFSEADFGGAAVDRAGSPLPEATLAACREADAILLGAVGGPDWDDVPREQRPESGLLALRSALGLFANLRPVRVPSRGVDFVIVRELTGGIYFGQPRSYESGRAYNTMVYERDEIVRIADVAFREAARRRRHVTSVDKANVLEVSRLWREVVVAEHGGRTDVSLAHMYVDNAAMQIVLRPQQFDVVLTGNLFGDILSDVGAALAGSLGVLPSASVGIPGSTPLFEPVHGSAPDVAGTGTANPVGAILSGAMLLRHSGRSAAADSVESAVHAVLERGPKTPDMGGSAHLGDVTDAILTHMKTAGTDS